MSLHFSRVVLACMRKSRLLHPIEVIPRYSLLKTLIGLGILRMKGDMVK
jgi:hypothetical protein